MIKLRNWVGKTASRALSGDSGQGQRSSSVSSKTQGVIPACSPSIVIPDKLLALPEPLSLFVKWELKNSIFLTGSL